MDRMEVNCSTRKLNFLQRAFYYYIRCPKCQAKMKKIDWPYEPGWKCPNGKCEHIVWEELPSETSMRAMT